MALRPTLSSSLPLQIVNLSMPDKRRENNPLNSPEEGLIASSQESGFLPQRKRSNRVERSIDPPVYFQYNPVLL